ncbi:MAG: amidohydrolase [Clostridia bacterium]|nr:amidohydrolase [Clostridia bacterium]
MLRYEAEAQQYYPELKANRRALHAIPELGNQEYKTKAYLMEKLRSFNPDELEEVLDTGIRCVFRGSGKRHGAIGFRSDIDALPIEEPEGCSFRSGHRERMHACGHDGHMAVLLGLAHFVSDRRDRLEEDVVLLFQPAEETTGGAKRMIEAGALAAPDVREIYGLHMMPDVPIGRIACAAGPMMASTCEIDVDFAGRASHGAAPHMGKDAILAASYFVTGLQSIVSRQIDPAERAVITIGHMTAGHIRNTLADEARLEGIVRTYSNAVFEQIESMIRDQLAGIEASFGVHGTLTKHVYYPCTSNNPAAFERVREVCADRFIPAVPRMTAEDFSYYQLACPGAFVFLGCMDEQYNSPLHSPLFGFDEQALVYGLAMFAGLIHFEEA